MILTPTTNCAEDQEVIDALMLKAMPTVRGVKYGDESTLLLE